MARFTSSVDVAAPVGQVWQRITDWPVHGRWIPFTTVQVTSPGANAVGSTFVGRTGLGPIGFDDPMEIVAWSPPVAAGPGYCRIQKHGRVVVGWADFEVQAAGDVGSTVRWTEEVEIAPVRLTRPARWLIAAVGKAGFDRALRTMARELEEEVRSGG
jgi:carbon monoxide dehydrogenase subunit G